MGKVKNKLKQKKISYYTVYIAKTDEIIASGIASDCAEQLGKTLNGFYSMVSKNTLGIHKKYSFVKEKVAIDKEGNIEDISINLE